MDENKVEITIDDQNRIRLLDVDVYKESEHLRSDCLEMIKSNSHFLNFDFPNISNIFQRSFSSKRAVQVLLMLSRGSPKRWTVRN